jgi:hypothetical protein
LVIERTRDHSPAFGALEVVDIIQD